MIPYFIKLYILALSAYFHNNITYKRVGKKFGFVINVDGLLNAKETRKISALSKSGYSN